MKKIIEIFKGDKGEFIQAVRGNHWGVRTIRNDGTQFHEFTRYCTIPRFGGGGEMDRDNVIGFYIN
jgi:hypothetical protein